MPTNPYNIIFIRFSCSPQASLGGASTSTVYKNVKNKRRNPRRRRTLPCRVLSYRLRSSPLLPQAQRELLNRVSCKISSPSSAAELTTVRSEINPGQCCHKAFSPFPKEASTWVGSLLHAGPHKRDSSHLGQATWPKWASGDA